MSLLKFIFIFLIGFITWGSLTPNPPQSAFTLGDFFAHFVGYFVIASAWYLDRLAKPSYAAALAIFVYSIAIELIQEHLVPGRDGSIEDSLANAAGVIVGWLLSVQVIKDWLWQRYDKRSSK